MAGDLIGISNVAAEALHGQRAAVGSVQEAIDDLRIDRALVVTGGRRAAGALYVAGEDCVKGERTFLEMAASQLAFDSGLTVGEPVERVAEVIKSGVSDV